MDYTVRSPDSEIRSPDSEIRSRGSEIRSRGSGIRSRGVNGVWSEGDLLPGGPSMVSSVGKTQVNCVIARVNQEISPGMVARMYMTRCVELAN